MKTSLVKLDGLNRSLTVELPIDTFNVKTDKVLKNMASQVKIDGFRKGKAPITLLKKRFGASASADAANEVVSETLADALEDSKSKPAVQPSLTNIDSKDSETFSYTVEFEIFPEIKSPDFSKIKVEQINFKITKEDEDRTLNGLKEQLTEYSPVKRKSKIGDRLTINFKGLIDGEVFDGGEAENFNLVLGKGSMIEGFEEGLTDIATNKDVTLNLSFPKDYHAQNLAAKDVTFEVNIKEIGSPKAPKMDEKFAEKFAEKSMDDLRVKIKEQMQMEAEGIVAKQNKADNKLTADKDQVNDKLIEISHSYGENAQQMIDYYKQDPQRLSGIESLVIEQMVVELVLETAKVKQKNMKFQEITQQR